AILFPPAGTGHACRKCGFASARSLPLSSLHVTHIRRGVDPSYRLAGPALGNDFGRSIGASCDRGCAVGGSDSYSWEVERKFLGAGGGLRSDGPTHASYH